MGEYLDRDFPGDPGSPPPDHEDAGLPDTDDSTEMIAQGWLEKRRAFEKDHLAHEPRGGRLPRETDDRGCLAMTWSGSLLNIGRLRDGTGWPSTPASGCARTFPRPPPKPASRLGADVRVGAPVSFTVGPIASSSPILKIAVTGEEMDLEEQERLITKATEVLTREFVKTNEDLEPDA